MYTREYLEDGDVLKIPKNYSGTTIAQGRPSDAEIDGQVFDENSPKMVENKESIPSWAEKLGVKSLFSPFASLLHFPEKFGTEEIILIALAVFLIFSKSGDIECVLTLIALLFV
jgi:hypothetical protein